MREEPLFHRTRDPIGRLERLDVAGVGLGYVEEGKQPPVLVFAYVAIFIEFREKS